MVIRARFSCCNPGSATGSCSGMDGLSDNPFDDTVLMAAAAGGDQEAFAAIVRRHQRGLVNFFIRLGASSFADDLAQETFVRLYRYRQRYRPTARFTTFLYTLARHAWYDLLRKRKRQDEGLARFQDETAVRGSERSEPRDDRNETVRDAVAQLPGKLRLVVVLSVYEGFDYDTIARIAGIPVGTVKSRMFLAIRRLKELLSDVHGLPS